MAYGKAGAISKSVLASAPGVYPRTITFAGPKSKRALKKSAGRKTLGKRK